MSNFINLVTGNTVGALPDADQQEINEKLLQGHSLTHERYQVEMNTRIRKCAPPNTVIAEFGGIKPRFSEEQLRECQACLCNVNFDTQAMEAFSDLYPSDFFHALAVDLNILPTMLDASRRTQLALSGTVKSELTRLECLLQRHTIGVFIFSHIFLYLHANSTRQLLEAVFPRLPIGGSIFIASNTEGFLHDWEPFLSQGRAGFEIALEQVQSCNDQKFIIDECWTGPLLTNEQSKRLMNEVSNAEQYMDSVQVALSTNSDLYDQPIQIVTKFKDEINDAKTGATCENDVFVTMMADRMLHIQRTV